jgi:succinate dehydrogenase hydrophobic anchor subunit
MKKNILVCVCLAVCSIAMLSFIEIIKTKKEVKSVNKFTNNDTTKTAKTCLPVSMAVHNGVKHVNIIAEVNKRMGNEK